MPIRTFTISLALALVIVLVTAPLGGAVQAAYPMNGWMMYDDAGSAYFAPNELPDPFERDFEGKCEWWQYELHGGHYVRTYDPCRYGDQEVDYSIDHRAAFQTAQSVETEGAASAGAVPVEPVAPAAEVATAEGMTPAEPETVTEEAAAAAEGAPSEDDATEETVPAEGEATSEEAELPEETPGDIIQTLAKANHFATLLAAAGAAGMADTLRGVGPYTVFAPTDDAFAATLPGGDLDDLLVDPSGELTDILLYHIVPGTFSLADLSDGMEVETLQGGTLTISVDGDTVMVDDASIVTADIKASNGVIYVIDAVLQPATE